MNIEELLLRLGQAVRTKAVKAQTVLFRRGEPTRHVYGVLSGEACLRRTTVEGAAITVHRAGVGSLFAEAALFSQTYHCDGEVVVDSEIALFPIDAVLKLMQGDADFATAYCQRMAGQVQRLRSNLELRGLRSAQDRVMAALSFKLDEGQDRVELDGTWMEFAQEIGLTHEALYRALKRLEDAGRLHRERRAVRLRGQGDI